MEISRYVAGSLIVDPDSRLTYDERSLSKRCDMVHLTTQVEEGPHARAEDCPTFHDGCHCTVETLIYNIKRAEAAEAILRDNLAQFRMYQAGHQHKANVLNEAEKKWPLEHDELERREDARMKAQVNKDFADKIEAFLAGGK